MEDTILKLLQIGNNLPASFICDPSSEFMPGMVAELTVIGNQVMATVSKGTAPIGIIDEIKTKAFTNVSWNETIIVPATGVPGPGGRPVTPVDIKAELKHPNVIGSSFLSTIDVLLNTNNGVITFVAGTELNYDLLGTGSANAIKTIVNYTYFVPNIPGDDSTLGSGRMTVWFNRIFFQTDMFESNQQYPVNANLYVSENGILTTRRPSTIHPAVALLTAPPSAFSSMVEVMWY